LEMIAGMTGFSGANYLCRVFKREVGVSPAAWRAAAAPLPAVPKLPPRSAEMFV
jgi:AraC-like DNA-binding protein